MNPLDTALANRYKGVAWSVNYPRGGGTLGELGHVTGRSLGGGRPVKRRFERRHFRKHLKSFSARLSVFRWTYQATIRRANN